MPNAPLLSRKITEHGSPQYNYTTRETIKHISYPSRRVLLSIVCFRRIHLRPHTNLEGRLSSPSHPRAYRRLQIAVSIVFAVETESLTAKQISNDCSSTTLTLEASDGEKPHRTGRDRN